ncbi:MAG: SPOR domain-containing protein [Rhodobacteraceae bacterium]|nr:SPOR domain-containing protein [Paracoccaceae bacterium]
MLEVKETAREGEGKQSNFNFNVAFYWVGAALSLSLLTGAIGWSYQLIVRDISQIPIVRAQLGPLRVAPDDPGGLTAANQGLSVTQLAVNERPLLSDEIFLAPAAEVLSEENVVLQISEENSSITNKEKFDTLEVSTENSLDLKILPEQNATGLASNNEAVLSTAAFSPKKLEIENAVSLALSLTNEVDSSFNSLRPKIRPVVLNQTQTDNIAQSVPNELVVTLPVGSAVVQLGAFESQGLAQSEWQRLEALLGSVLTSKNMVIQKAESGGKVFYRLRAFGFDDLSDARQFCSAVNDKVECIPVVTR